MALSSSGWFRAAALTSADAAYTWQPPPKKRQASEVQVGFVGAGFRWSSSQGRGEIGCWREELGMLRASCPASVQWAVRSLATVQAPHPHPSQIANAVMPVLRGRARAAGGRFGRHTCLDGQRPADVVGHQRLPQGPEPPHEGLPLRLLVITALGSGRLARTVAAVAAAAGRIVPAALLQGHLAPAPEVLPGPVDGINVADLSHQQRWSRGEGPPACMHVCSRR